MRSALVVDQRLLAGLGRRRRRAGGVHAAGRAQSSAALQAPRGRTAILVPIYNEDPVSTFSRVAAMNRSLIGLGVAERFDFAILSDTNSRKRRRRRPVWFERWSREPMSGGRIFYRRRSAISARRPAISRTSSAAPAAAYEYALILDADSLMDGATIVEMVRRMEADPELGLLQTLPHDHLRPLALRPRHAVLGDLSLARLSRVALRLMQGNEGPYWGHNAMVRVRPLPRAAACRSSRGKPPFGGHILSHDYVEAALLARAGWKVRARSRPRRLLRGRPGEPARIRQARPALVPGQSAAPRGCSARRAEALEPLHLRAGHHGLCGLAALAAAAAHQHRGGGAAG